MQSANNDFCKRLVYWSQYGPTCWFNALLMATLYSQRSRSVVLRSIDTLDDKIKIYKIFKHILKYKYVKSKKPEKDIKFFADIKPEKILKMLNNYKSKKFMFKYDKVHGFNADLYIKRFYKLLNVDCMMLLRMRNRVIYDPANHVESFQRTNQVLKANYTMKTKLYMQNQLSRTPDVLIVRTMDNLDDSSFNNYVATNPINRIFLKSNRDSIRYNNAEYELDAVILNNWNEVKNNHSICGITCNGERYVYNGWTIKTSDAAMQKSVNRKLPCELMKFNWNIKENVPFCLNNKLCKLDIVYGDDPPKDLCFSFNKGWRTLIYVKKSIGISDNLYSKTPDYKSMSTSKRKQIEKKECADGKIRDPVTKRCIGMKTAIKRNLINTKDNQTIKPISPKAVVLKPCKNPDKIRDGRTGRCVTMKTAKKRGLIT